MKTMPTRPQNWHRLPVFAAASLGLHIALLLAALPAPPHVTIEHASTLTISLDIETPAPANRTAAVPAPTTQRRHYEPAAAATVAWATPVTVPTEPDASDSTESDGATGGHSDDVRSWALTKLNGDLRRHFEYPLLARRRGWEGTVWLSFVVAPDGVLEHVHVVRGSGYDALDRSALTALRRVGHLPEARVRLDGRALEMQLPVIYRLSE